MDAVEKTFEGEKDAEEKRKLVKGILGENARRLLKLVPTVEAGEETPSGELP